jgi:peroxiredoxin
MSQRWILWVLVSLTVWVSACVNQDNTGAGIEAPEFRLRNLKGGETALSSLRGKVVLVNFWATWCGPCRAEMPSMEALYGSYDRADFAILAISIDTVSEERVRAYVDSFGFSFPILLDPHLIVNELYQVRVVPMSLLIDRTGKIHEQILGARDWSDPDIRLTIQKLIGKKNDR